MVSYKRIIFYMKIEETIKINRKIDNETNKMNSSNRIIYGFLVFWISIVFSFPCCGKKEYKK
jgi:hypothetical protein